jgi:N-ethylmaleimide reductase
MKLLSPIQLGALSLKNRVIMAPLTRMRATQGDVPGELAAQYYSQRASAGLIISEATQISNLGKGYPATPGIYSDAQVAGWKKVTEAVHAKDGKMVCQLWHVGRISHSSLHPSEGLPVAPSAIAPSGKVYTATWQLAEYETPRPLTLAEIPALIQDYVHAAQQAKAAGFDGVEVHGANGYLLDQFLHDGSNKRDDQYGGSVENRSRLLLEVLRAVIGVWGADRVGVRLSPYGTFNDMSDRDTLGLFTYLVEQLNSLGLSYLHLIEPRATMAGGTDKLKEDQPSTAALFRPFYQGNIIAAGGFDRSGAEAVVSSGHAEAIAFGRLFISNPDLPERLAIEAPLNPYDRKTFYGGGAKGYVDYTYLV